MSSEFNPLLTMEACVYVKSSIPSMSKWKDVCLVLMPDSTFGWYKINRKLIGSVKLASVCKYLCVGHMAKAFAKAPKLPRDADLNQLLGVPMLSEPAPDKMHWFCFDHVKHLIKFLQALDKVLAPLRPPSKLAAGADYSESKPVEPTAPPPPTYDEVAASKVQEDAVSDADSGGRAGNNDDKRKALLTAGGLLATGLLLGPDSGWTWGYGWSGVSGPLFQDIDERELLGYCLPARGLRGIAGPGGCGSRGGAHRYNRAYQRFNSDLGNDPDRWDEDQDRRSARRRSDAAAVEEAAATAEELSASLAAVSAAAAAAAGADHCLAMQDFYDIDSNADQTMPTAAAASASARGGDVEEDNFDADETACRGGHTGTELTSVADYRDDDDLVAGEDNAATSADGAGGACCDDDDQLTMAAALTASRADEVDECCDQFNDCCRLDGQDDLAAVAADDDAMARERDVQNEDDDLLMYAAEHADVSDGHCQGECGGDLYDCRDADLDLLRDEEDLLAERELEEEVDDADRYGDVYGEGDGYGYGDDGFGGDGFGRDNDF